MFQTDADVDINGFFNFIEKRLQLRDNKNNGATYPWSSDDILNKAKINNIHREDDKTTKLIFSNIKKLKKDGLLIWANILTMRFTNRISTIEKIFPIGLRTKPQTIEKSWH